MKVMKRDQKRQSRRARALARFVVLSFSEFEKQNNRAKTATYPGKIVSKADYDAYKVRKEAELSSLKAALGV